MFCSTSCHRSVTCWTGWYGSWLRLRCRWTPWREWRTMPAWIKNRQSKVRTYDAIGDRLSVQWHYDTEWRGVIECLRHWTWDQEVWGSIPVAVDQWYLSLLQVNRSSNRSWTWGVIYTKINLISPGCPQPNIYGLILFAVLLLYTPFISCVVDHVMIYATANPLSFRIK